MEIFTRSCLESAGGKACAKAIRSTIHTTPSTYQSMHVEPPTSMHCLIIVHTQKHARTRTARAQACTHAHKHARKNVYLYTRAYMHTHMHSYVRVFTRTHTRIY